MKPQAALLTSPGMGHLIPVLELGKRMVVHHGFHVTIFVVANTGGDRASTTLLNSPTPDNLDIVSLPPVDTSSLLTPDAAIPTKLVVIVRQSLPFLRSAITSMVNPPIMMVVDLFGIDAFSIADEFEMLRYVFDTNSAWFLALTVYAPTAVEELVEEHVKAQKPLEIPGCKSLRFDDTLSILLDQNDPSFEGFIQLGIVCSKADGILVNSWEDLESSTFEALRDATLLGQASRTPVYPIGPLARRAGPEVLDQKLMDWLDNQPAESVIYVSFGSGGTLSAQQITELAWGLELSLQRFIWVVRPPSDGDAHGSYFTMEEHGSGTEPDFLPDGFSNRTRDVGLVVPRWAPQADILSHSSVGGFLSHCGWNSSLESLTNGVPMIAWPLYAEQRMNATMLMEEVGVAIGLKQSPTKDGVVGGEVIGETVRKIMAEEEGRALRRRAKELKCSAVKALSEAGSSHNSMSQVAKECLKCLENKYEGATSL